MRSILLLLVCLYLLPFPSFSQERLQKSFAFEGKETTVGELLQQISSATGYSFSYSSQLLNPEQPQKIKAGTLSVQELLEIIFHPRGLDFFIQGDHIILKAMRFSTEPVRVLGSLLDSATQQALPGATLYFPELKKGVVTDSLGRFEFSMQPGPKIFSVRLLGYEALEQQMLLKTDTILHLSLAAKAIEMDEVVVQDQQQNAPVQQLTIGKETLVISQIENIPSMFGEVDILKSLQMLPGIQSGGEGFSGLMVRGGSADQTLVMLNNATVYSPTHLMGFFSIFNPDAIQDVEVYKGGVPPRWGGRLSSVVNTRVKKGSDQAFKLSGGIGLISSRLSLEGPIKKNKASFLISARRTYLDLILKAMPEKASRETQLYFYDLNGSLHFHLNPKNQLRLQAYSGSDRAGFYDYVKVNWGNRILSGEWLHAFNSKLLLSTSFHYSQYGYGFRIQEEDVDFNWSANLKEYSGRLDFDYHLHPNHTISFGYQLNRRSFSPVILKLGGKSSYFRNLDLAHKEGLEQALYLHHEYQLNEKLNMLYGLRYSFFNNLGPGSTFVYQAGMPKNLEHITDTLSYASSQAYHTYHGAEPRIMGRYTLDSRSSVKFSYTRMQQYTQVASSATASLPTDRWIPSDPHIKPQVGDQLSAGYFRKINSFKLDLSAEVYYKFMRNQIDFKDGISLSNDLANQFAYLHFNNAPESQLLSGKAWSYGLEMMLRKKEGRFTGWLAYTLSRTRRQVEGINSNQPYSPRYDRPHDLKLLGNYKISNRLEIAANWVYTSGSAITLPEGKYLFEGRQLPYYNPKNRNNSRLPDYHRLDFSLKIYQKEKKDRRWKSYWTFSVYNAYMRENPLFVQFINVINNDPTLYEPDVEKINSRELKGVKVFFSIIPAVSYNFRF